MKYYLTVLILLSISLASCSGSSNSALTPVQEGVTADYNRLGILISDYNSDGSPAAGMGALGLFSLSIDPSGVSAELTPFRNTALTDVLEVVDITNFLQVAPCTDCAKIQSVSLDEDGNVIVSIGLKHPFEEGDPFKPITGRNRGDLHVFNIEGTIFSNNTAASFPGLGRGVANFQIINASGYSGYLNPVMDEIYPTSATIHPYILHFDDYSSGNYDAMNPMGFTSVTNPPPSGNLVMAMGSDYDFKDYVFALPDEPVDFIYAVGCTYAVSSASKSERFTPEYRVPQHNKKAASEVHVEVTRNQLRSGVTTSDAEITVRVLDINHNIQVGTALNEMAYESNIYEIIIEIPGVIEDTHNDYMLIGGEPRNPEDPLTFTSQITNSAGASMGQYMGLVKVLDSYPVGQNQSPLLNDKDGIQRVDPTDNPLTGLFDIAEFATYAVFDIAVGAGEPQDPIAIIKTIPDPPVVGVRNPLVSFDGSDSYNPDGSQIILFDWDFDWDGDPANFSPDVSTADSITDKYFTCYPGEFTVALRVTDNNSPSRVSEIASVKVTVFDDASEGNWEGSVLLGPEIIHGDTVYTTGEMIHVDSNGVAHLFSMRSYREILHRTYDGVTISDPEIVYLSSTSITVATALINSNDELHVFWIANLSPRVAVYHTQTVGGVFTGTEEILFHEQRTDYFNTCLTVAINKDDHMMATWINYDWDKADVHYMYVLDTGSGFSPAANMPYEVYIRSREGENPSYTSPQMNLATTPDGKFHYFARSRPADLVSYAPLYQHVYDYGNWEPKKFVISSYYGLAHPKVVADKDGNMHLSVRIPPLAETNMRYSRYDAQTDEWSDPPLYVAWDARGFQYGHLEIDPAGFLYVTYCSNIDDLLRMKVFCEYANQDELDATPSKIIDDGQPYHLDVETKWHDGTLMALYQSNEDGITRLHFNRYLYD